MLCKDAQRIFCLTAGLLGVVLIGLGVFLLATSFPLGIITIGTIISGIILLVICGLTKCARFHCLACLLLLLKGLILIISGILTLILIFDLVIGLILISLCIIALILTVICPVFRLCCNVGIKGGPPYLKLVNHQPADGFNSPSAFLHYKPRTRYRLT